MRVHVSQPLKGRCTTCRLTSGMLMTWPTRLCDRASLVMGSAEERCSKTLFESSSSCKPRSESPARHFATAFAPTCQVPLTDLEVWIRGSLSSDLITFEGHRKATYGLASRSLPGPRRQSRLRRWVCITRNSSFRREQSSPWRGR